MDDTSGQGGWPRLQLAALIGGPLLAVLVYLLLPAAVMDGDGKVVSGLSDAARACAAVAVLMACWWLTEAIPLSATALLPIALFPLLGIRPVGAVTAKYGDEVIFLFLGGFILGLAMERSGLQRRLALMTIAIVGTRPAALVLGMMVVTAVISMFVSNTATCLTMLPIAMSLVELTKRKVGAEGPGLHALALALLLGVAYASSIGGMGTLIGTPPNAVLAGFCREKGIEIGFAAWMLVGVPVVMLFLPFAWWILTRPLKRSGLREIPGGRQFIRQELRDLGRPSRGEWTVLVVFAFAAALWIARPFLNAAGKEWEVAALAGLSDAGIAMLASVVLFIVPTSLKRREFAMDWKTCERIPWGVLILFGGGLALADALTATGVDRFVGSGFSGLSGAPPWVITLGVAATVIFLSELCSNTALATAMMPVLWGVAMQLGMPPGPLLVSATLAASAAFMMPVGTPPNAIVFATGHVRTREMAMSGLWLNLWGIVLVTAAGHLIAPSVLPAALFR